MNKLQHTPGPWNEEGIYTILRYANKHDMDINESDKMMPWSTDDARLIAAAPEMLEELIKIYTTMYMTQKECYWMPIKLVIEKATGMSIEEVLSQ